MSYILIIDDDEDFANTVATVLQEDGHETDIELDTDSGLESLDSRQPDLLILDVMFPEDAAAGFELARELKQRADKFQSLPVLMLTAINQQFPLGFGRRDVDEEWLPVAEFLEKPVDFDTLREKVNELLEESE